MNRRSPAFRLNPAPTGAVCALTVWLNIGPPVDTSMAIIIAIDHAFFARTPRHVMLRIRIPLGPQARLHRTSECGNCSGVMTNQRPRPIVVRAADKNERGGRLTS